jgi:hypothetical protein
VSTNNIILILPSVQTKPHLYTLYNGYIKITCVNYIEIVYNHTTCFNLKSPSSGVIIYEPKI